MRVARALAVLAAMISLMACGNGAAPDADSEESAAKSALAKKPEPLPPSPILQAATPKLVDQVLSGKWGRKNEDDTTSIQIEFYGTYIFTFTVQNDKSACFFHFYESRDGASAEFLNRAFDRNCDGVYDAFLPRAAKAQEYDFRPPTKYERAFLEYHLPRYVSLFEAANGFRSWLPKGKISLIPDLQTIRENSQLTQEIVNTFWDSDLARLPADDENYDPQKPLWKIWVNGGVKEGGYVVSFVAENGADNYVRKCLLTMEIKNRTESFLDNNCDGDPELRQNNKRAFDFPIVGNESVAKSALLEIGRFARVANAQFTDHYSASMPAP